MWRTLLRLGGMLAVAFVLSWGVIYDLSSISYLAPMEKASDFTVDDFYQLVADSRQVRRLDDKVVIVAVDGMSRQEIAGVIEAVDFCAPRALGVDLLFNHPQPGDTLLVGALSSCSVLVAPECLAWTDGAELPAVVDGYIYDMVDAPRRGVVNLDVSDRRATVRSFRHVVEADDGSHDSFVTAMARQYMGGEAVMAQHRRDVSETIRFDGVDFDVIAGDDVLSREDDIRGKAVLIGTVDDRADMHPTPVDGDMPGVMVHAHALAMVLGDGYVNPTPEWVNWAIAVGLCLFFIVIQLWIGSHEAGNLFVRIFQVSTLLLIVLTGCHLYMRYGISVNFSRPLVMVAFGLMAVDVWVGGVWLFKASVRVLRRIYVRCRGLIGLKIKRRVL